MHILQTVQYHKSNKGYPAKSKIMHVYISQKVQYKILNKGQPAKSYNIYIVQTVQFYKSNNGYPAKARMINKTQQKQYKIKYETKVTQLKARINKYIVQTVKYLGIINRGYPAKLHVQTVLN